jgi:hypothetical protein
MIFNLINASVICIQMISLNGLCGVILIYCMLNGVRCQCRGEVILNILTMQSTAKHDKAEITIVATMIEEK